MRAECLEDVIQFWRVMGSEHKGKVKSVSVTFSDWPVPDVVVEFESTYDKDTLDARMLGLNDPHVMRETLQPIELYTGIRV